MVATLNLYVHLTPISADDQAAGLSQRNPETWHADLTESGDRLWHSRGEYSRQPVESAATRTAAELGVEIGETILHDYRQ